MDQQRQKAFQKLRPVCVELSSTALKFKGHQTAIKDVLLALEAQRQVLQELGSANQLDEKLAEYAFFPLTHVFNESKRLSSRCMEVAVQAVILLVDRGWRAKMAPVMGKQLLILMSLLAGSDPRKQTQTPTDELKSAAFICIEVVVKWLSSSPSGKSILEDQSTRNIVDQLAYLLIESITEATSDQVQIAAAETLLVLVTNISNRVFLASLLPRTVSALTKALKPSTQARRTRKVLVADIKLLKTILTHVLADDLVFRQGQEAAESTVLDGSWLKATVAQIKNALTQVCKLRNHNQAQVRESLCNLCIILIEECGKSLEESVPVLLETTVVLLGNINNESALSRLKILISVQPTLVEILRSSFYNWCQSLPRVMRGSDDRIKELMLTKLKSLFSLLSELTQDDYGTSSLLSPSIVNSIAAVVEADGEKFIQVYSATADHYTSLIRQDISRNSEFDTVLFNHESQRESAAGLENLISGLRNSSSVSKILHSIIDNLADCSTDYKIASLWLAMQLLRRQSSSVLQLDDILDISDDQQNSSTYIINDLYSQTKDMLMESSPFNPDTSTDPRITALALESVARQSQQLGPAYRTELYETLYPVLALLSSRNDLLQKHAITTLNILASSCGYNSVSGLLIENVDYLVNSIAWKLNTFNLSPEAPAVLNMMIRLVGARVVPFLDDLISSIFAALDSFHGYTQWVEMLFEVLRAMVDECVKSPELTITSDRENKPILKFGYTVSTTDDLLSDIRSRKRRKLDPDLSTLPKEQEKAPKRPWTKPHDDPNYISDPTEGKDIETLLREAETADLENDLPAPQDHKEEDQDLTKPLSKSHDLLLKIASATVPHLSSPSVRVRQILLQLLAQISPLLARHENTFLPLINAIWPGIVQRLFADITVSDFQLVETTPQNETGYNVAAASAVAANLCENAGDFMTSRIEQIFPQLKTMYSRIWKDVDGQMSRNQKRSTSNLVPSPEGTNGSSIKGVVDLQVIKSDSTLGPAISTSQSTANQPSSALTSVSRTSTGQILTALVRLLGSILDNVRISEDNADQIFGMLESLLDHPGATGQLVNQVLERYNSDAVWVIRCRKAGEDEIVTGIRATEDRSWRKVETPKLRESLRTAGVYLQPIVF